MRFHNVYKILNLLWTLNLTFFAVFVHIGHIHVQTALGQEILKLGQFSIYPDLITLSGFTSGGGFAQQLQISYSSIFKGIAVFQHAFYRCGPGDGTIPSYDTFCTLLRRTPRDQLWRTETALQDIEEYYNMGIIENPNNLRNKRLYVYSGTENYIHAPDLSMKIMNIYEPFIRNPSSIMTRVQTANLTMPTNGFGGHCARDAVVNYFLSNCGLSGPHEALKFLLGSQVPIHSPPLNEPIILGPLEVFDQSEFTNQLQGPHYMDTIGFLYVPLRCYLRKCLLHFYFHGCNSGRELVGENHIRNSGFLEIAEMNGIIIVFPQIVTQNGENELGCWDTYGRTGKFYATQRGTQIIAIRSMIARILGEGSQY